MTRRTFFGLTFASAALASRWEETQFPDWKPELIDRLVTNSPWSRPWRGNAFLPAADHRLTSTFNQIGGMQLPSPIPGIGWPRRSPGTSPGSGSPFPRGGSGSTAKVGVDLTIRWASALPVRRAFALQECGSQGLNSARALELLADPKEYVIEVAGIPRVIVDDALKRDLQNARVSITGHRSLRPVEVQLPSIGASVTARLKFARFQDLGTDAGTIELSVPAAALHIEERFRTASMIYEGRLEL